ncbi:MAG TPA: DUF3426 domain-containing protein [Stellaceae bacterium]|nr:DUF3426 domain-containing protein [Stellaceae bacterium]
MSARPSELEPSPDAEAPVEDTAPAEAAPAPETVWQPEAASPSEAKPEPEIVSSTVAASSTEPAADATLPPKKVLFQPPPRPDPAETEVSPENYRIQLPAIRGPERRVVTAQRGGAAVILLVMLLIAAVVLLRAQIVGVWPAAAKLYTTMGLPVPLPWDGLVLRVAPGEVTTEGDKRVYVVSGDVTNSGTTNKAVPGLQLSVIDTSTHKVVRVVPFTPQFSTLAPGALTGFKVSVEDPPAEVTGSVSWVWP